MGTRRLSYEGSRAPHYGMAVTDATGIFMLISQRTPASRGDENLVWRALRLDAKPYDRSDDYLLLLDPDQFGEIT